MLAEAYWVDGSKSLKSQLAYLLQPENVVFK